MAKKAEKTEAKQPKAPVQTGLGARRAYWQAQMKKPVKTTKPKAEKPAKEDSEE